MKESKGPWLEDARSPSCDAVDTRTAVEFCIQQLYADEVKSIEDEVAHNLTYGELIGALLGARDRLREDERYQKEWERLYGDELEED